MTVLIYMIPVALLLGAMGLAAFVWALKSGQFEDPAGAAARILSDDDFPADHDLDGKLSLRSKGSR
jgi:cbb3-type cytochrome oxidase maturation protein